MSRYRRCKNGIKCIRTGYNDKWCSNCEEIKSKDEFNSDKGKRDRLSVYCRDCSNIIAKNRYVRKYPFDCLKTANGVKWCPKCEEIKDQSQFRKSKNRADGLNDYCKECLSEFQRKDRENGIPERERRYRKSEKGKKAQKRINENRKGKEWYEISTKKSRDKKWLSNRISANIRNSLDGNKNGYHWEELVDFTIEELEKHLESQFQEGMTWENYGEWHIDHIKPVSLFQFESYEDTDFKECWCLENLQPLWAEDNLKKNNRWEDNNE